MNCGDRVVIMMEEYSAFSESAGSRTRYPPAMRTLPGHDTIVEFIESDQTGIMIYALPSFDQQHSSGGHHSAGRQKFFLVLGLRQRMITSYYQRQTSRNPIELVNFPSNHPLLQVERSFCKSVLDPISVSNPFKVQIDAIADEVQKMNQVASKIALVVISKMDGKPEDVHDEEYHTMIEGMLSDKEFRKTLPAGLVEQYYNLTCGYTAILGNHKKTTNPSTFLNSLNSSNDSTSQFLSRPSESQQSKESSMSMARDILLGNRNIDTFVVIFQEALTGQTGSLPGSDLVPLQTNDLTLVSYNTLRWTIDACNYDGTSLGLNIVNPSTNHSQKLSGLLSPQLGVTTRTDDQISRPSVTPIKDSIGHHPPKEFSSYVAFCDNNSKNSYH
ncbi:hypothetical protein BY996DRAFT_6521009 [Phakopsora pachyrhizi]|nr:hypothetical protein BY996DRAFT_6521009 [Phakopsora pachyrhizi]